MKAMIFCLLIFAGFFAAAEELLDAADREPANVTAASAKRTYPGAADEDDLQVQAHIPEAAIKTDARTVQRNVFKTLYNQEMKDQSQENLEE